jgi:ferredoxin
MRRALTLAALLVICLGVSGCISVWPNLFDRDDRAFGTYQRP